MLTETWCSFSLIKSSGSVKTPSPSPSPKKRSRSPAKKSPRKSRSRSQSRSRSAGRQPAARSRSRSAGRYAANKTPAKELKTPEKPKRSPSRKTTVTKTTVTTSSQENVATTPTRVSRRLQEKIMVSGPCISLALGQLSMTVKVNMLDWIRVHCIEAD